MASADDFASFEKFASGPWNPEIVSRMPWDVLARGRNWVVLMPKLAAL